jgi:peptidyl-prolyl cis-trans isomerase SurA
MRIPKPGFYALVTAAMLALLAAAFTGCSKEPEPDLDPIALRVNGKEIRVSELQAQIDQWNREGGIGMDLDQFVDRYIHRTLAVQEALERGLDQDLEIRHQYENMLIGRLRRDEFERRSEELNISEEAVAAHYEASIADYTKPAQVRIALLELENSRDADAIRARLEEAARLAAELPEDTQGFGALAIHYSEEGSSRFRGGDVGWMQAGMARYRWPDAVVAAAFGLSAVGELSEVLETEGASYLLMKLDGRPERIQPLDDALAARIHRQLLAEQQRELKHLIEAEWADGTEVVANGDALSQLNFTRSESNERSGEAEPFSSLTH